MEYTQPFVLFVPCLGTYTAPGTFAAPEYAGCGECGGCVVLKVRQSHRPYRSNRLRQDVIGNLETSAKTSGFYYDMILYYKLFTK